jgi:hypothetical protein
MMDKPKRVKRHYPRVPLTVIGDLLKAGHTHQEVAAMLGVPELKARKWCWRARNEGYAPKKEKSDMAGRHYAENHYRRHGGPTLGSMEKLLGPLDIPIIKWLIGQTPEGATLADTVRAMVTDTYYDEMLVELPRRVTASPAKHGSCSRA